MPGMLQADPGHSLATVQAAPLLLPLRQRLPPQMGPIGPGGSGQSAFAVHGSRLTLLHVSQAHFTEVSPMARQFGLAAESVKLSLPVVFERSTARRAISDPASNG